jgi:hypothetical protein
MRGCLRDELRDRLRGAFGDAVAALGAYLMGGGDGFHGRSVRGGAGAPKRGGRLLLEASSSASAAKGPA